MRGLWLVVVLLLSGTALAADRHDIEGQYEFRLGKEAFEAKHFSEAYEHFKRAYLLSERPALLFNMALALEEMKRPHESAETLRSYLRLRPKDPDRAGIEGRIEALEEKQRLLDSERAAVTPSPGAPPKDPRMLRICDDKDLRWWMFCDNHDHGISEVEFARRYKVATGSAALDSLLKRKPPLKVVIPVSLGASVGVVLLVTGISLLATQPKYKTNSFGDRSDNPTFAGGVILTVLGGIGTAASLGAGIPSALQQPEREHKLDREEGMRRVEEFNNALPAIRF
jgi:tetratricopeptide (TPR) repeat protein